MGDYRQSGHYQFRVGPGDYKLSFPHGMSPQPGHLAVTDQDAIVQDAHALRKDRDVLQGTAGADDGQSVAGALILGETIGHIGHAGFQTKTDDQGCFKTERWLDPMLVLGRDVNANLAGSVICNRSHPGEQ